ncbi:MAG: PEP-CTERM sorting domain-containing protein [Planctomycetes bacterium]|nr:PEP-CTERM sorting domain-containing protein [Planctomycetota bacterium]
MAMSASGPQVPEPSTLVLAALGLISLGLGTRRRRRRE